MMIIFPYLIGGSRASHVNLTQFLSNVRAIGRKDCYVQDHKKRQNKAFSLKVEENIHCSLSTYSPKPNPQNIVITFIVECIN